MKFFHPLFLFFFSLKLIFIFCNYSFSNENNIFQSINIHGSPGYIDMPSAKSFNDGQLTFTISKDMKI